ncbi:MAG: S-adenosylmethionine:tRNA ribosyltransferase-isomerase [Bacteroidota bacterium]
MDTRSIDIAQYEYDLPAERIAVHPVHPRDSSRLLIYRCGQIRQRHFSSLAEELPSGTQLCVNDSKVIPARLIFEKPIGGRVEIFCLEPDAIYPEVATALATRERVIWRCFIGGASKWKKGIHLQLTLPGEPAGQILTALFLEKGETDFRIEFQWPEAAGCFGDVLERAGRIPLPPYIKRSAAEQDKTDYQTAYAANDGSVAAPTAGLHFTDTLLDVLRSKGIDQLALTLHVGAGTFKPVMADRLENHTMHSEWIHLSRPILERLLFHTGTRVAVGTTALRTLESIYWLGARLVQNKNASIELLTQWEPYTDAHPISPAESIKALLEKMNREGTDSLWSRTELLIAPGYSIRMADGMITNFHQPRSTLLLLISALVGDNWRQIYQYALENDFRFLSYGDGSLLWRTDS